MLNKPWNRYKKNVWSCLCSTLTSSCRHVWPNCSQPIWYCSLANGSPSTVISFSQTLCRTTDIISCRTTMHIYVETAVYLVKRHRSISEWTVTRELHINIDWYSCCLLREQCHNCLTANEKQHETVMTSCRRTQRTHSKPVAIHRRDSSLWAQGKHSEFGYKINVNCNALK
jgi:hypothetical protein